MQLWQREGGRNPLPRLQSPTEVRSLVLSLHHRQTELSKIVAIIRNVLVLRLPTINQVLGNDAQECR